MLCNRVAMLKQGRIVALDNTHNLIGKMTAGNSLRLRLLPDILPEGLQGRLLKHEDGVHELRIDHYAHIEAVLAALRTANIEIVEMHLQQPDLEDVFINIMKNNNNSKK